MGSVNPPKLSRSVNLSIFIILGPCKVLWRIWSRSWVSARRQGPSIGSAPMGRVWRICCGTASRRGRKNRWAGPGNQSRGWFKMFKWTCRRKSRTNPIKSLQQLWLATMACSTSACKQCQKNGKPIQWFSMTKKGGTQWNSWLAKLRTSWIGKDEFMMWPVCRSFQPPGVALFGTMTLATLRPCPRGVD